MLHRTQSRNVSREFLPSLSWVSREIVFELLTWGVQCNIYRKGKFFYNVIMSLAMIYSIVFRFSMIRIKACLNYFIVSELAKLASIAKIMLVTGASYKQIS